MLSRRSLALGAPFVLALPSLACGQGRPKVIGFLNPYLSSDNALGMEQFHRAMRSLGYAEGTNYSVMLRAAGGKNERLRSLADELVLLKVDVIVAAPTDAVIAAQQATADIPIVFFSVADPVRSGFADTLAHPGHNLTGLSNFAGDLNAKRFELMKQMQPSLTNVAILGNPTSNFYPGIASRWPAVAEQLGLRPLLVPAHTSAELEPAFKTMTDAHVDAVIVVGDAFLWNERQQIAELALRNRLPTMFNFPEHVEAGGLMSYGADTGDAIRRVATYVDKILRGAKPADLPIEQADKVDLVINLKTARLLKLTVPRVLLLQAARVIE
jgi:putative ABC transport system substrate-binding protein